MRKVCALFVITSWLTGALAQKTSSTSEIITPKQIVQLFPDTICKKLGISFPIFRVYKYADKAGQYYCILTESREKITSESDTLNQKIKAINVQSSNGTYVKLWEINDNTLHNDNENSIWFWTKYIEFRDYDGDALADPIIAYGTSGINHTDDGRIKFIIYSKGRKIAIRHQNSDLDFGRETQVDRSFYDMPQSLQKTIKEKMELMVKNKHAIFPRGWQTAMKYGKTTFNERN